MNTAYFDVHFLVDDTSIEWPAEFLVITACATTGQVWTLEKNRDADRRLEEELRQSNRWLKRITCYSPKYGHVEPGWAVELPLETGCKIGVRFQQDAIYWVKLDTLLVTFCQPEKIKLVHVGLFRGRLRFQSS